MLSEYEAYACERGTKSPRRQTIVCSGYEGFVLQDGRIQSEPSSPSILKLLLVAVVLLVSGWLVGGGWAAPDSDAPQVQQSA